MTSTTTRRYFLGLAPDEATCADIHERVRAVLDPQDWRLHEPEDLHLTLCFLGETAKAHIPGLCAQLRAELDRCAALELTLQGVGWFGDPEAPRVLWVGVTAGAAEGERLIALRQAASHALERVALRWDSAGTFTPHLTVARPRRQRALPAAFRTLGFDIVWRPTEVVLFASVPGARPHYPKIDSFALGN